MKLVDAAATHALGLALAAGVRAGDVIAITGPLGAGKTSLARGLLAGLGLAHEAPSPSFAIVQPYDPPEVTISVLHVDLYRIDDPREIGELGIDEVSDALLIVEWPDRAGAGYWSQALSLTFSIDDDGGRSLTADVPPAWRERWPLR